jgi:hypothetical protein
LRTLPLEGLLTELALAQRTLRSSVRQLLLRQAVDEVVVAALLLDRMLQWLQWLQLPELLLAELRLPELLLAELGLPELLLCELSQLELLDAPDDVLLLRLLGESADQFAIAALLILLTQDLLQRMLPDLLLTPLLGELRLSELLLGELRLSKLLSQLDLLDAVDDILLLLLLSEPVEQIAIPVLLDLLSPRGLLPELPLLSPRGLLPELPLLIVLPSVLHLLS